VKGRKPKTLAPWLKVFSQPTIAVPLRVVLKMAHDPAIQVLVRPDLTFEALDADSRAILDCSQVLNRLHQPSTHTPSSHRGLQGDQVDVYPPQYA
jgi:hypothetical protein